MTEAGDEPGDETEHGINNTVTPKAVNWLTCIAVNPCWSKPLSRVCEPVFPLCRPGSFIFSLVPEAFSIPINTCGSRRKKQCCAQYACTASNDKSHFWWDFLAYCTRTASVNLMMAFIGCSFDSFSVFLLSLKQQNLMKIMFSCIHFPVWPYPPNEFILFILYC